MKSEIKSGSLCEKNAGRGRGCALKKDKLGDNHGFWEKTQKQIKALNVSVEAKELL